MAVRALRLPIVSSRLIHRYPNLYRYQGRVHSRAHEFSARWTSQAKAIYGTPIFHVALADLRRAEVLKQVRVNLPIKLKLLKVIFDGENSGDRRWRPGRS
jgi:hypothetical protein